VRGCCPALTKRRDALAANEFYLAECSYRSPELLMRRHGIDGHVFVHPSAAVDPSAKVWSSARV
jgi:hypothetical protein